VACLSLRLHFIAAGILKAHPVSAGSSFFSLPEQLLRYMFGNILHASVPRSFPSALSQRWECNAVDGQRLSRLRDGKANFSTKTLSKHLPQFIHSKNMLLAATGLVENTTGRNNPHNTTTAGVQRDGWYACMHDRKHSPKKRKRKHHPRMLSA